MLDLLLGKPSRVDVYNNNNNNQIFFLTKTFSGVELFPTHLRSTAMAVTLVAARLGAILGNTVFGLFLEVQCAVPIIMVAALLVGQQPA